MVNKPNYTQNKTEKELIGHIGFGETVTVDYKANKKVLITGANSYIGDSFTKYANEHYPNIKIDTVDTIDGNWKNKDFSNYDIVYHVAGIAHADVGNVDDATKQKYYSINTNLAIDVCKKAKQEGVKEFIFMSSMIVYGDSAPYGKKKIIDENTVPFPANFYGDSKLQADVAVRDLATNKFKVIVLRPPMIYGKGSKGNYPLLSKLAKKLPIFPDVDNERSMLYIENLCEFLCQVILVKQIKENSIVLLPQNKEYSNTSKIVKEIAKANNKNIKTLKLLSPAVKLASILPGKIGGLVNKAFGNNCYKIDISNYNEIEYQIINNYESIEQTECCTKLNGIVYSPISKEDCKKYSVLMSVYKNDKIDYLCLAIESMLKQTVFPDQFVIVEDGPVPKEIDDAIINYSKSYSNLFSIVRLEKNGGLGNALNQGLKVCRNELIARMDADDISKTNRCELQLSTFSNNPNLGILGAQIDEFINDTTNVISKRIVPTKYEDILKFARRRSPFNHPTVMYRKSVIEQLGGYIAYGRKEDLDLFIRALNEGVYAQNTLESLLYYRTSNDNLQRRRSWVNCKEYIQIMNGFRKKGYINIFDYAYVFMGQMFMYLVPNKITQAISNKFLRKQD